MNHAAKEHLKIKEDSDLRTLLRNVYSAFNQDKTHQHSSKIHKISGSNNSPHALIKLPPRSQEQKEKDQRYELDWPVRAYY